MQPKPLSLIEPGSLKVESGDAQHPFNHLKSVFVAVLRVDPLAGGKSDDRSGKSDHRCLFTGAL